MNNINIPQKHPYEAKASQKQKKLIKWSTGIAFYLVMALIGYFIEWESHGASMLYWGIILAIVCSMGSITNSFKLIKVKCRRNKNL